MSEALCPDCGHPFEITQATWIDRLERWIRKQRGRSVEARPGQCQFRYEAWDSLCGCQGAFHGEMVF
jgi:hypothetical protein